MKNFKKIVSLICVAALVLSMSAFANIENDEYVDFNFSADKSTVKVGDTVTLTLGTAAKTGTVGVTGLWAYIEYDAEGLTFTDKSDSFGIGAASDGMIAIEHDGDAVTVDYAKFVTIPFVANAAGEYTIALTSCAFLDEDYDGSADDTAEITITVEEAGPVETLTAATYENADTNELTLYSPATGLETTYTNVPVFKASASGTFGLRAAYGDGETHDLNGGAKFDLSNFNVGTNGVDFQVAIVGVPADITITTLYVVE